MAYVTGLAMRRAADLYTGAAKTDPKDAAVLADYARRNADRPSRGPWSARSSHPWARSPTCAEPATTSHGRIRRNGTLSLIT